VVESCEGISVGSEAVSETIAEPTSGSLGWGEDPYEESAEAGEWVRKSEAASRLGVSERTIENRVAAGKLAKRFRNDGTVEILVPKTTEDDRTEKALFLVERFNQSVASQLVPVLEQNRELITKVTAQAETIGELRKETQMLREKVTELEQGSKIQAKPWWRFWSN
jgi:hypothetical protein